MVSKRVLFLAAAVLMLALASGLPVEQEEGERRQLHDDSCHLGLPACYVYVSARRRARRAAAPMLAAGGARGLMLRDVRGSRPSARCPSRMRLPRADPIHQGPDVQPHLDLQQRALPGVGHVPDLAAPVSRPLPTGGALGLRAAAHGTLGVKAWSARLRARAVDAARRRPRSWRVPIYLWSNTWARARVSQWCRGPWRRPCRLRRARAAMR